MTHRRKKGTGKRRTFFWITLIVICAVAAYLLFAPSGGEKEEPAPTQTGEVPEDHIAAPAPESTDITGVEKQLALIIDDIGHDLSAVNRLLDIKIPVTFAILPHCPYSLQAAEKAHEAGRDILLHLPMEPHGYPEINPGEGALYLSMSREELKMEIERDIRAVPYIIGANNHMGSRFMEDNALLEVVLGSLKSHNLFFIDSMTTSHSAGSAVARKVGIGHAKRNVFIDNGRSFDETFAILNDIISTRDDWTSLILIGHPHSSTIEAIAQAVPLLNQQGIRIVPVSRMIRQ